MISFSYQNFRALLKAFPICPMPEAVGLENIPLGEPLLYVYNHVTRRAEPLFLGLAAPVSPPIRFLAEITVLGSYLLQRTRNDIADSLFSRAFQEKIKRQAFTRFCFKKFIDFLSSYFTTQMGRFNLIPVCLHPPANKEEKSLKLSVNRQALKECLASLEKNIPVALAPSGGSYNYESEGLSTRTIVPMLASLLFRRGKTVKIIPCVVKERPKINSKTYKKYIAERIFIFRLLRWMASKLGRKKVSRPHLTVEFLPPLVFPNPRPTKTEKLEFTKKLQQLILEALNRE